MIAEINIPEGIQASVEGSKITVRKDSQEIVREFPTRMLKVEVKDNNVIVSNFSDTAKSRAMVGTIKSHVNNMINGLQEPFVYKLKICSVHFPMSVKQSGNMIEIQNFLGEKKHRKIKFPQGADIKIEGPDITISSSNKEIAGMIASKLEQATRLRKKDRRIFQDGIFIIEKAGKSTI
jgi:large subunit ribosomal protein L6